MDTAKDRFSAIYCTDCCGVGRRGKMGKPAPGAFSYSLHQTSVKTCLKEACFGGFWGETLCDGVGGVRRLDRQDNHAQHNEWQDNGQEDRSKADNKQHGGQIQDREGHCERNFARLP